MDSIISISNLLSKFKNFSKLIAWVLMRTMPKVLVILAIAVIAAGAGMAYQQAYDQGFNKGFDMGYENKTIEYEIVKESCHASCHDSSGGCSFPEDDIIVSNDSG